MSALSVHFYSSRTVLDNLGREYLQGIVVILCHLYIYFVGCLRCLCLFPNNIQSPYMV